MVRIILLLATVWFLPANADPVTVTGTGEHRVCVDVIVKDKPPKPKPPKPKPPVTPPKPPVSGVTVINTTLPNRGFSKRFGNATRPQQVFAMKFKTANTNKPVGTKASAARIPESTGNKLVEISSKPGGAALPGACRAFDAEAATVTYYINVKPTQYACVLKPNTQYYVNVYAKVRRTATKYTCTGNRDCQFLYTQQ